MLAEWSAECSADDPVLVVPWSDPANPEIRFVDLRENPYDMDHLLEAEQNPPLMQALRSLNAARSPVFTAKCDAWPLDADELETLRINLDPTLFSDETDTPAGFGSYIDLLCRERSLFASFHQQEQILSRLTRRAAVLDYPQAVLDCVLRPAMVDLIGPQEGFAISLYVKAIGPDPHTAWELWSAALDGVIALLRSKELALA
jgi:hypothetical protein